MREVIHAYCKAVGLTAGAVILGIFVAEQNTFPKSPTIYSLISMASFTVGTIGRVGWKIRTWDGKTQAEKIDKNIFLGLFFVGAAAAAAAVVA